MGRQIVLMGDTSDGGWFGGTPFDLSSDNVKAMAQETLDNPAVAQSLATANGVSPNYVRAAAAQAVGAPISVDNGTGTKVPSGGGGSTVNYAPSSAVGTGVKVAVLGGLGFLVYYVAKAKRFF